jgi:hypothetical protein
MYPKGKFFEDWLKKVGYASEYIVKKAAEEGTQVHEMIEEYLEGKEMNFLSPTGYPQYNPDVWQMFLRFVEFWETYKPKLIEAEVHLFSDELKVAGTCELNVEKMTGKGWEMVLPTRTQEENLDIFRTVRRLFDLEHPNDAPVFTEFKTTVKREL